MTEINKQNEFPLSFNYRTISFFCKRDPEKFKASPATASTGEVGQVDEFWPLTCLRNGAIASVAHKQKIACELSILMQYSLVGAADRALASQSLRKPE